MLWVVEILPHGRHAATMASKDFAIQQAEALVNMQLTKFSW